MNNLWLSPFWVFYSMQEGLWATEDSSSKSLLSYPCPPQYCQCALGIQGRTVTCRYTFDSKNKDSQCTCDRKGDVCMWYVTMFQHMNMMCHWVCVYVFVIYFSCVVSLCRCCVYTCCVIVHCVCLCVCVLRVQWENWRTAVSDSLSSQMYVQS